MLASDQPIPLHDDAPSPLPDPMPSASFGKRRIKKTEKARALEDNSDSDGPGKKTKQRVEKARVKKRMPRAKAIPEGNGDSEDSQNGDDDDVGGKIECVFSLLHLARHTNTCKSWRDASLTWALISAITDDPVVKQGLFPSPGANVSTSKGDGKPKTDHHYAVALAIFGEHEVHQDAFRLATGPKDKAMWGKKIKNRIQTCVIILFYFPPKF